MSETPRSFFATPRLALTITLLILFGLGLGIRLYDLTDLPLDFHSTRQLRSALIARGMYYRGLPGVPEWQRQMAIQQWKLQAALEPEVLERVAAFTYRFTGEQLWVGRIYSSLFWTIGGVFLFLVVRDLISTDGAVIAVAYYLFLPYTVIASRSFQPDPLMVMLILSFWWAILRWTRGASWGWALLAGLLGGLAIFIKLVAAFFVSGAALGAALGRHRVRELTRNPQVWAMTALGILPGAAYIIHGVFLNDFLGQRFSRFIPALLLSPLNYLQWETKAGVAAGGVAIMLGLLGLFFVRERSARVFLYGLWGMYVLFGLYFDYYVATHDYYHLPLIPIVAVSLASLADWLLARLAEVTARRWLRVAAYIIFLYGLLAVTWDARNLLKLVDYRPEAAMWAEIGERLGHQSNTVALTQDYGSRLNYWGWQTAAIWPTTDDIEYHTGLHGGQHDFESFFDSLTGKKDFFLVTDLDELNRQPDLKERLYSAYSIYAQADGYIIFDLRQVKSPP